MGYSPGRNNSNRNSPPDDIIFGKTIVDIL